MDQAAVVTGLRVSIEFGAVDRYAVYVKTCVYALGLAIGIWIEDFPQGKNEAQKTSAMLSARAIPEFAGARSISCSLFQAQTAVVVENVEIDLYATNPMQIRSSPWPNKWKWKYLSLLWNRLTSRLSLIIIQIPSLCPSLLKLYLVLLLLPSMNMDKLKFPSIVSSWLIFPTSRVDFQTLG